MNGAAISVYIWNVALKDRECARVCRLRGRLCGGESDDPKLQPEIASRSLVRRGTHANAGHVRKTDGNRAVSGLVPGRKESRREIRREKICSRAPHSTDRKISPTGGSRASPPPRYSFPDCPNSHVASICPPRDAFPRLTRVHALCKHLPLPLCNAPSLGQTTRSPFHWATWSM